MLITYTNKSNAQQFIINIQGVLKKPGGERIDDQSSEYAWWYESGKFKPNMDDLFDTRGTALRDKNLWIKVGESVRFVYGKQCGNDIDAARAGRAELFLITKDVDYHPTVDGPMPGK